MGQYPTRDENLSADGHANKFRLGVTHRRQTLWMKNLMWVGRVYNIHRLACDIPMQRIPAQRSPLHYGAEMVSLLRVTLPSHVWILF